MGAPYGVWCRAKNPAGFWLATVFNVLVMLAGVLLLLEELSK